MDEAAPENSADDGNPRLVAALGGMAPEGAEPAEFSLRPGITTVGSAADADLRLDGLDGQHAEIRYDADGEYVWVDLGTPAGSRIDGQPMGQQDLHTGDRIEVGGWTLVYQRAEFADHVRPEGGRQGGEGSGHPHEA